MKLKETKKRYWIVEEGGSDGFYYKHYCANKKVAFELSKTIKVNPYTNETVYEHIEKFPKDTWKYVHEARFTLYEEIK